MRNDRAGGSAPPVPPKTGQGPVRPPYPRQQGHRPCTLPAKKKISFTFCFPHVTWGTETRAHGRNENVEKSRSGKYTFLPVFSHFPRMQSIRSAVLHTAQPVARSAGNQFANAQSSFMKGFLRVAVRAPNSQSFNRSFALMCVRATLFHRDIVCVI